VQKSALKSVNVQRTGKSILQMFAFSFFDGSHICRFLPILRPPPLSLGVTLVTLIKGISTDYQRLIFADFAHTFGRK